MTKPKDFIINSDYLSLAQFDKQEFEITFPQKTVRSYYGDSSSESRQIKPQPGAIDRIILSVENSDWVNEIYRGTYNNDPDLKVVIKARRTYTSQGTSSLSVFADYTNATNNDYTYPAITVKIKLNSFKPPNVL